MSACRDCNAPINWQKVGGRNVPLNPDASDHRDSCPNKPTSPCRHCGAETVYRFNEKKNPDGSKHECAGVVPSNLKRAARRHVSYSQVARFDACQLKSYFADVLELPDLEPRTAADAGTLAHAAHEHVIIERAKAKRLREPVTVQELHDALDLVLARERWTLGAVELARAHLEAAAPRLDMAFVASDEHGPIVERGIEVPLGDGVLAGSTVDFVEFVGSEIVNIVDLKFGAVIERSPADAFQVGLYLTWGHAMWPEKDVRLSLRYVTTDVDPIEVAWTREIEENAKALGRAYATKRRSKRENQDAWPATWGTHCGWCSYKGRCPEFKAHTNEVAQKAVVDVDLTTLEGALAALTFFRPLANVAKRIADKARDVAIPLVAHMLPKSGRGEVATADGRAYEVKFAIVEREGYTVQPTTYTTLDVKPIAPGALPGAAAEERGALVVANAAAANPTTSVPPEASPSPPTPTSPSGDPPATGPYTVETKDW